MAAMGGVVVVSNVLVQYPLGQWLTYGALSYPFAFLVTDLITRREGIAAAKRVIVVGMIIGIICSLVAATLGLTTLRITIASATAFFIAQLVDVHLFDRLKHLSWWGRPAFSSTIGSIVDTTIFFTIAFSATTLAFMPDSNTWALEALPLLGVGQTFPLWVSLAVADLFVKLGMVVVLLVPYRILMQRFLPTAKPN
jgi:uncharacterized PurR-regulated membrane protein YhhQ (DUF165 family)